MSKFVQRHWPSDLSAGLSRRDRRGCEYAAYIPDILADRRFRFDGDVAADLVEAEASIALLNEKATALGDIEALARLLLRAECVASSKVITVSGLLEVHRRLLARTRLAEHGGKIREQQNWIGGNAFNPCSAVFVPPPHEEVVRLLQDLCGFCNGDSLPAVAQAAIAHAQFETIHPFIDGNGRTGRVLLHVILKRRGLAPRVLAPVSLVLATWSSGYLEALMETRYHGDPDSPEAVKRTDGWVAFFSTVCTRAVSDAAAFEEAIQQ